MDEHRIEYVFLKVLQSLDDIIHSGPMAAAWCCVVVRINAYVNVEYIV